MLQGERKVIPSPYHQAFCAGGIIHPSKGKQHICRQEDMQKKQLSSSVEVLERCLGASLGLIRFLAYSLPFCSRALCFSPPREDLCLCLRPCTRSWFLRLWKHEYAEPTNRSEYGLGLDMEKGKTILSFGLACNRELSIYSQIQSSIFVSITLLNNTQYSRWYRRLETFLFMEQGTCWTIQTQYCSSQQAT